MARNCIVINLDRCIGCYACVIACKMENDTPLGENWNTLRQVEPFGTFPDVKTYWIPKTCQQCQDAPCINVCPTGASQRDEDGIVTIDPEACIGCQLCMSACPYGVRCYNAEKQVVEKCTLCKGLRDKGEKPACVKVCCGKARFYGDLDDPESDASIALAQAEEGTVHYLPDEGNGPLTAYILSSRFGEWRADDLAPMTGRYDSTTGSLDY